jgi:arylsulfatase A-like enzyme
MTADRRATPTGSRPRSGSARPRGLRLQPRLALIAAALLAACAVSAPADQRTPNVVFVIADDLGYGDLGSYGQKKIRTPNLDRMAAEGMRFTQHYSGSPVCAPSRCVLMTGRHPGHAFVRDNREWKPEGQHPIPADPITLARLFRANGYATGGFGKWGLGGPGSTGEPLRQGFDRFFGYNCQAHAHNFYPTYLWDNDRRVTLDNPEIGIPQKLPNGADPDNTASYRAYAGNQYSADLIFEQARRFVRDHRDRPFLLYVPTTVPHLALQVPEDSLAEYLGQWPDPPYVGGTGYLPHRAPRAAYAAMVTRMDREVGRIMDLVRELGLDHDTIFVFTSDNGPLYERLAGTDSDFFQSAGPLRGRKGSLYEGGFRVPMIVRWKGHIAPGTVSDRVTGFEDWLPTLMELIGAADSVPTGIDGSSFAPTLFGHEQPPRPFLYREFPSYGGQQSVRIGDWKGVRQNLNPRGKNAPPPRLDIELYNLSDDVGETTNVAAEHPDIVARIERLLREQHTPSPDFPIPALDRP